jgi:hypothetical protein
VKGREVMRTLFQDHLGLRARREARLEKVVDANGVARNSVEADHLRPLQTVFGEVVVTSPTVGRGRPTCTRRTRR